MEVAFYCSLHFVGETRSDIAAATDCVLCYISCDVVSFAKGRRHTKQRYTVATVASCDASERLACLTNDIECRGGGSVAPTGKIGADELEISHTKRTGSERTQRRLSWIGSIRRKSE